MPQNATLSRTAGIVLAAALAATGVPSAAVAAVPLVSATPAVTVGFDGLVYSSVAVGSTVYLGGSFRNAIVDGRTVVRKRLAAVDVRTGKLLPWAPEADGTVLALAASGSSLYASGKFSTVGRQARAGLADLSLATGAVGSLKHTVKGEGTALAVGGGRLWLGGSITAVDGRTVKNLTAFRLSDGAADGAGLSADGQVRAMSVAGSRLYVGGGFKTLNGTAGTTRLAALRLSDAQVDTGFRPVTPWAPFALTVSGGRVYAGLSGPGGRVQAYTGDGTLEWSSVTDGDIQAITALRGTVYAGGHFTVACDQPSRTATSWCAGTLRSQPKLLALNPDTGKLLDWNPRSNGRWGVLTLAKAAGTVAVGGEFTAFGGLSRPHFAVFCPYGCGGR